MTAPLKLALLAASLIDDDGDWEGFDIDKISNWPRYKAGMIDENTNGDPDIEAWLEEIGEEGEELDTENLEVLTITDDEATLCCGGDWQPPGTVTIKLVAGILTVTEAQLFSDFSDGIDRSTIIDILANP